MSDSTRTAVNLMAGFFLIIPLEVGIYGTIAENFMLGVPCLIGAFGFFVALFKGYWSEFLDKIVGPWSDLA